MKAALALFGTSYPEIEGVVIILDSGRVAHLSPFAAGFCCPAQQIGIAWLGRRYDCPLAGLIEANVLPAASVSWRRLLLRVPPSPVAFLAEGRWLAICSHWHYSFACVSHLAVDYTLGRADLLVLGQFGYRSVVPNCPVAFPVRGRQFDDRRQLSAFPNRPFVHELVLGSHLSVKLSGEAERINLPRAQLNKPLPNGNGTFVRWDSLRSRNSCIAGLDRIVSLQNIEK
jgi:hypothetical protein